MPLPMRSPAVFFDRDGTLMEEVSYCADPAQVRVFPGVPGALRRLRNAGFRVFVITNQAGISRGIITEEQYRAVATEFLRQAGDGLIDATYYCADPPDAPSERRKPAPGMVLEAAADHRIDLSRSYFVGDKTIDVECGRRAGVSTVQVLTGYGNEQRCAADFTAANIVEAAEWILSRPRPQTPELNQNTEVPCGGCTECCKTNQGLLLHPEQGDDVSAYQVSVRIDAATGNPVYFLATDGHGACVYLGSTGCTIYDRRPWLCRSFDCRKHYLILPRQDRDNLVKLRLSSRAVFNAGRARVKTLSALEREDCLGKREEFFA